MAKRCSLAAAALLLVLVFHCAAAARLLLPAVPPLVHQDNGVKAATVLDGLLLRNGSPVNRDDFSVSEMMMGTEEDEEPACDVENDECLQRRLLRDAHLDYIYTQHKGKP